MEQQSDSKAVSYVGINVDPWHVKEMFAQGLIQRGERVLAVFDGQLRGSSGERLGGFSLHDYLALTPRRLLFWARGWDTDVVDGFPLQAAQLVAAESTDAMHARLSFSFVLPRRKSASRRIQFKKREETGEDPDPVETRRIDLTLEDMPIEDLPVANTLISSAIAAQRSGADEQEIVVTIVEKLNELQGSLPLSSPPVSLLSLERAISLGLRGLEQLPDALPKATETLRTVNSLLRSVSLEDGFLDTAGTGLQKELARQWREGNLLMMAVAPLLMPFLKQRTAQTKTRRTSIHRVEIKKRKEQTNEETEV